MASPSDGLVPWKGQAGDVRVGHIIQGDSGTKKDVWRVIDTRNPNQYDLGRTPWLRVQRLGTEETVAIPPKIVKSPVTFMLTPEEFDHSEMYGRPPYIPRTPVADADAVALLVQELGATEIATKDEETGEIWCPDYEAGALPEGVHWRDRASAKLAHLRICHGMDVTALEEMDWEPQMHAITKYHGEAHRDNLPGGFPHRHVPETNLHML